MVASAVIPVDLIVCADSATVLSNFEEFVSTVNEAARKLSIELSTPMCPCMVVVGSRALDYPFSQFTNGELSAVRKDGNEEEECEEQGTEPGASVSGC